MFLLSSCESNSTKNPAAYKESIKQAKKILRTNSLMNKYKKYYDYPNHKAFAMSKTRVWGFVSNRTSREIEIKDALKGCQKYVKKSKDKCLLVNVDNEWVESKKAKKILETNVLLNEYKKYYSAPNHKAFTMSKAKAWGFVTNRVSREIAIEDALQRCQKNVKKPKDKCVLINVDNEWVEGNNDIMKRFRR